MEAEDSGQDILPPPPAEQEDEAGAEEQCQNFGRAQRRSSDAYFYAVQDVGRCAPLQDRGPGPVHCAHHFIGVEGASWSRTTSRASRVAVLF